MVIRSTHPLTAKDAAVYDDVTLSRFWSKVDKRGPDECWPWLGAKSKPNNGAPSGYGTFRSNRAHRVSYTLIKGEIPQGLVLDHLCRNPECVNPAHLEAVTQWLNTARGVGPTAQNLAKTICKRGHPLVPENIRLTKKGYRYCRECAKLHSQQSYQRLLIRQKGQP